METNKEVKIAIIVGMIMITICLVFFIMKKESTKTENLNLRVYKLYELSGDSEKKYEYRECSIDTDTLISLTSGYRKAFKLTDKNRVVGEKIKGNYKIVNGDDYIAFDGGESIYVYRSNTKYLYEMNSTIYSIVEESCK